MVPRWQWKSAHTHMHKRTLHFHTHACFTNVHVSLFIPYNYIVITYSSSQDPPTHATTISSLVAIKSRPSGRKMPPSVSSPTSDLWPVTGATSGIWRVAAWNCSLDLPLRLKDGDCALPERPERPSSDLSFVELRRRGQSRKRLRVNENKPDRISKHLRGLSLKKKQNKTDRKLSWEGGQMSR